VIAPHTTGRWNNVAMFIPAIAPSRLAGCGIINVNYVLKASWTFVSVSMFLFLLVYFLDFYRLATHLENLEKLGNLTLVVEK